MTNSFSNGSVASASKRRVVVVPIDGLAVGEIPQNPDRVAALDSEPPTLTLESVVKGTEMRPKQVASLLRNPIPQRRIDDKECREPVVLSGRCRPRRIVCQTKVSPKPNDSCHQATDARDSASSAILAIIPPNIGPWNGRRANQ
jgi:hypothetical protein